MSHMKQKYTYGEIRSIEESRDQHFNQAMRNGQLAGEYKAQRDKLLQELRNYVRAERYNREYFADDGEFVDWVRSRARYLIDEIESGK
jgi:uncharacterized coiled-coil DUF342 family protein